MRHPSAPPRRFAIGYHPHLPGADQVAALFAGALNANGIGQIFTSTLDDALLRKKVADNEFDVLVAVGGDGTMLRAGRLCAPLGLPVLGINMGHFGFLMEVQAADCLSIIPGLIKGQYGLEDRLMICATHWHEDVIIGRWDVLNEVVVSRGEWVRPVQFRVEVDGYPLTDYVADGLIVATPTGSTAYALAAGGPILAPELQNMLIIPVAPHLSVDRAVVIGPTATVRVKVRSVHQAVLSVDGSRSIPMQSNEEVHIAISEPRAVFVRFQDPGYFYRNLTRYMEQNPSVRLNND